jgi:membrane-associated protease RseP (regulator of RpoE activity)
MAAQLHPSRRLLLLTGQHAKLLAASSGTDQPGRKETRSMSEPTNPPADSGPEAPVVGATSGESVDYHRSEGKAALAQLLFVVGATFFASLITGVTKTLFVILAIVIMVFVHELGHYLTAKWSGMKVTEFYLGFGPRLWSFKWGETEYGIRAIPAGAYVRVIGMNNLEEVEPHEEHRAFRSSPAWRRIVMASAGSFMHFVMAFVISVVLLTAVGVPSDKTPNTEVGSIVELQSQSPALAAGLKERDEFVSINNTPVADWDQVVAALSASKAGQAMPVVVRRDGAEVSLTLTPVERRTAVQKNGQPLPTTDANAASGFVGVGPELVYDTVGPGKAITKSVDVMGSGFVAVFRAFGDMFSPSGLQLYWQNVTDTVPEAKQVEADQNRFVSPVGLVNYADDAANAGWFAVLSLLFSINLFIGIFNMFPLLPFDGGHVAVAIYERIRSIRRPTYHADYAKLLPVSYAVILLLVFIAGTSLWLDVTKPLENQFK